MAWGLVVVEGCREVWEGGREVWVVVLRRYEVAGVVVWRVGPGDVGVVVCVQLYHVAVVGLE